MKANGLVWGACLVFAATTAANAEVRIESLTPPLEETIVGWNAYDKVSARELEASGIAFSNALLSGYNDLSESRRTGATTNGWRDPKDAEHFNQKARTAARRSSVLPDEPTDRDLSDQQRGIFHTAVVRLRDMFDRGGRETSADDAALAQVSYDCWIEATEYDREDDIKRCRGEFESALARANQTANYSLTPAYTIQMAALPPRPESYLIYFEWDSTTMTPAGQAAVQEAIRVAQDVNVFDVALIGHADRSGANTYNQTLSEKRALVVIQAMTDAGIGRSRISWNAFGEMRSLVPTADGVREQGNRVVEAELN